MDEETDRVTAVVDVVAAGNKGGLLMADKDGVKEDESLELETLEVETRIVEADVEPVAPKPSPEWIAAHERGHAQKVREHLAKIGR